MGPGSAAQRHSASKTRVNALMALHRIRDTQLSDSTSHNHALSGASRVAGTTELNLPPVHLALKPLDELRNALDVRV
jgi:hypothetical protein